MEIDYNNLINMAGTDGHSLQPSMITIGIDYVLDESYTTLCLLTHGNSLNEL